MRKKKILLIIVPVLLLLIAGTIFGVLYFTTDSFKSGQELFARYFIQNGEIIGMLENANLDEQETFKKSNSYNDTGELVLNVQSGSNAQEIKANVISVYDANTKRKYNRTILKNAGSDLLEVSYINSGDVYAIKCNDITPYYIGFRNNELKTFAKNMGVSDTDIQNIPDRIEFDSMNHMGKITSEEKQHLIDTYSKVIFENIPKEKYNKMEKTQISIEENSYAVNGYCVTIEPELSKQIVQKCLETLKSDNTTLVMISNKLSSVGIDSSYTDITKLAEIISSMADEYQKADIKDTMKIEVYENNGKTIRTIFAFGEKSKITIDRPNKEGVENAIITMEIKSSTNTNETNELGLRSNANSQLIIQKIESETETTNEITFIPNIENKEIQFSTNTTIGKVQGDIVKNTSTVTATIATNGTNIETTSATYTQNIQKASQVEEIAELKNSNTIIVNNYTKQQLIPFLSNIGNKAMQVLPNKVAQLGIDFGMQQTGTNGMTNFMNEIYKVAQIAGTTVISIANVNGIDVMDLVGAAGGTALGAYINNQAQNSVLNNNRDMNTNTDNNTNISTMEVQTHNAQFLNYAGEQRGSTVRSLCDIVKMNNASNINGQIILQMTSATAITNESTTNITGESIDAIKAQIQPTSTYTIDFGYSKTTGKIVAIGIVKK